MFVLQYPFCQLVYVCARVWKYNRKTAGNIIVIFPCDVQFFFDHSFFSPVDFRSLEGVTGFNVSKSEKKSKNLILRWIQVRVCVCVHCYIVASYADVF